MGIPTCRATLSSPEFVYSNITMTTCNHQRIFLFITSWKTWSRTCFKPGSRPDSRSITFRQRREPSTISSRSRKKKGPHDRCLPAGHVQSLMCFSVDLKPEDDVPRVIILQPPALAVQKQT